jgi:hypothetical protein
MEGDVPGPKAALDGMRQRKVPAISIEVEQEDEDVRKVDVEEVSWGKTPSGVGECDICHLSPSAGMISGKTRQRT